MPTDHPAIRRSELEQLRTAVSGEPSLTLLTGDPGSGTTTLVRALVAELRAQGGTGLRVTSPVGDRDAPGSLFTRLTLALTRTAPGAAAAATAGSPQLATVLAALDQLTPRPALVVLEDLHHADETSLGLLGELVAVEAHLPVPVIVAFTSPDSHRSDEGRRLLHWLRTVCPEVHLGPLTPAETAELVTARAGQEVRGWAEAHAEQLTRLTGGTPLLIAALVEDLALADGARPELTGEVADLGATTVLDRVVTTRLAQLGPEVGQLLEVVLAAGPHADPDLVEAVTRAATSSADADPDGDAPPLRAALASGLLRRVRARGADHAEAVRLELTQPVVASVLRRLGPGIDAEHHLRTARELGSRGSDPVRVLHHLVAAGDRAGPGELARAAERVLTAPARWEDAEVESAALTALLGRDPDAAGGPGWRRLGRRLADAWYRAGQRQRSWQVARQVLAATPDEADEELLAAAALLARGQVFGARAAETADLLVEAADRLGDQHPGTGWLLASAAELAFGLPVSGDSLEVTAHPGGTRSAADVPGPDPEPELEVVAWDFHPVRCAPLLARATELAARHGDDTARAQTELTWAKLHRQPAAVAERIDRCRRVLATGRAVDQRPEAAIRLVIDQLTVGARREVARALAELATTARATGDLRLRWWEQSLRTMLALADGDLDRARQHLTAGTVAGQRSGEPAVWIEQLVQGTALACEAGQPLPELAADHAVIARLHPARLAGVLWVQAAAGQPLAADPAELVAQLPGSGPVAGGELVPDPGYDLLAAALLAEVVWLTRRTELADELLAVLAPWEQLVAVDTAGSYAHGTVARQTAALHWLRGDHPRMVAAEHTARQLGREAGLQRDLLAGELDALVRAEEDGRIEQPARREGLARIAARADALGLGRLARTARVRIDPQLRTRLTERQLVVLDHLDAGRTYEAIAAELGYSHGTIRKEAIRLYAALGVDNRDAAVARARQAGLVGPPGATRR